MNDTIKVDEALKDYNILLKRITKTIENGIKEQNVIRSFNR